MNIVNYTDPEMLPNEYQNYDCSLNNLGIKNYKYMKSITWFKVFIVEGEEDLE